MFLWKTRDVMTTFIVNHLLEFLHVGVDCLTDGLSEKASAKSNIKEMLVFDILNGSSMGTSLAHAIHLQRVL